MGQLLTEDYLKHWGVKGMRWGVRKRRVSTSKGSGKSGNRQPNGQRRMSNNELTNRVKRLKLEKNYRDLMKDLYPEPKTKSNIEKLIATAGTVATLSGHASTIYKNVNSMMETANKGA